MHTTSARFRYVLGFAAVCLVAGGSLGCAELARATPSLTVDASAFRRRQRTETRDADAWSWGVGVRLGGAMGVPPTSLAPEEPSEDPPAPRGSSCRVPAVCEWEARARSRAIERARVVLEVGALR